MPVQDFMWVALGISALVIAGFLALVLFRLAGVLERADEALAKVGKQLDGVYAPVTEAVTHVNGVAATADRLAGQLVKLSDSAENALTAVGHAAGSAQAKVAPSLVKIAAFVAGLAQGARTLFGRDGDGPPRS